MCQVDRPADYLAIDRHNNKGDKPERGHRIRHGLRCRIFKSLFRDGENEGKPCGKHKSSQERADQNNHIIGSEQHREGCDRHNDAGDE